MLPKFLIISSTPSLASAATAEKGHENHYGDVTTKQSNCDDVEKGTYCTSLPPYGDAKLAEDPEDPFACPALPPIEVTFIKRVDSPDSDSEIGSVNSSFNNHKPRTMSHMPTDYIDRSVLSEKASSPDSARAQDEAGPEHEQDAVEPTPRKLRAGGEVGRPVSTTETTIISLYEEC
jgi:hypothetical protein